MQQNHWTLEIHANDLRQRRMREAELARQIQAASPAREHRQAGIFNRFARFIASRGRGVATSAATVGGGVPAGKGVLLVAGSTPPIAATIVARRPVRQTDPYAAMAIVARGSALLTLEEPCGVRDC